MKRVTLRSCLTEEIQTAYTDGEYYYDEDGNKLDCTYIAYRESGIIMAIVCAFGMFLLIGLASLLRA